MENLRKFQSHYPENGVVLAIALISNCDSKDRGAPVPDKALATSIEDGFTTYNLGASAVDLISPS